MSPTYGESCNEENFVTIYLLVDALFNVGLDMSSNYYSGSDPLFELLS